MSRFFTPFLRWAYGIFAVILVIYFSATPVLRSDWNKERLYRRLLTDDSKGKVSAALDLIYYGGEKQLLLALKSDSGSVREVAANALADLWARSGDAQAAQLMDLALKNLQEHHVKTSLTALNLLTKRYPFFAEGWYNRAVVLSGLGFYSFAIADCKKTILLNPNHFSAWLGLGTCEMRTGDFKEAQEHLSEALRLNPYDESTRRKLNRCNEILTRLRDTPQPARGEEI